MNIEIGTILFSTINFVIFYFILKKFVFNKTLEIIDARRAEVEKSFDEAKEEEARANLLRNKYDESIKKYNTEGQRLVESYKEKADRVYAEIIEESNKEASLIKEKADREIEREKEQANKEMKQQIIDLSIEIAEKTLEREIDTNLHKELVDEFIAKVGI